MKNELTFIPAMLGLNATIREDECLVFTHIPKAAGTTLDRLLKGVGLVGNMPWRRAFGTVYHQFLGQGKREASADFAEWSSDVRQKVRIITGHVPFGLHENLPRSPRYVTLLREPVARTVSHYKMGLSRQGWTTDTPIDVVFRNGGLVGDVQVRMLAGLQSADEKVDDAVLARAIDNLARYYYLIGLSDTFDEFTSILLGFLDAPNALVGTEQTTRVKLSAEAEEHARDVARKHNYWDCLLYEEAKGIAQAKFDALLTASTCRAEGDSRKTLLASSQIRISNNEYSVIPKDQFSGVIKKLKKHGVEIRTPVVS